MNGNAVCHARARIDEVCYSFCLYEVDSTVHNRATGELSRECLARSGSNGGIEDEGWYQRASMN
jgi:hypothetical protein